MYLNVLISECKLFNFITCFHNTWMEIGKIQEKAIYSSLLKKDREAFVRAYDLYVDKIYRYVYFKVGKKEEAQDLTSEVFLKAWNYIQDNQISNYKTLKALFYKIARNLVIDYYRKKSNKESISLENEIVAINIADENQNIFEKINISSEVEEVLKRMSELKDEYREALALRYIDELSITEISEILEKTKGNTRVLVFRALKTLKENLLEKNKGEK